jgi:hypothetical protein
VGSCEQGNEHLGSIKHRGSLDWLKNYCLLKKDSAAWGSITGKFKGYMF